LNLDASYNRKAYKQVNDHADTIKSRIMEMDCHLVVPNQDGTNPFEWSISRLQASENLVTRLKKMGNNSLQNGRRLYCEWNLIADAGKMPTISVQDNYGNI